MADEQSGTEAPAQEAVAAPAPAVDTEKEELRKSLAAKEAELGTAQGALREVGEMVKTGKLRLHEEQAAAAHVDEDDSALVDRKELKRHLEDVKKAVAGAVIETSAQSARLSRQTASELLKPKLKNYEKYAGEINGLLDKMDPRVAADPNTIMQAYKVVRGQHIDEEIEEEVKARTATRYAEEDDGDDMEVVERAPGRVQGSLPSASRSGVAPMGDGGASRQATSRRDVVTRPLSRDEKIAANFFGIKDAAEYRRYADKSWKPDLLGSKGREKF